MYKNKAPDGTANLCGRRVAALRKQQMPKMSQRALSSLLQLSGLDLDKNAIQRIECGKRFVTDIELKRLAAALSVPVDALLQE